MAGRYNYTTPKSYLELIALYKTLLANKREALRGAKTRLENGVEKIAHASKQVCLPASCCPGDPVRLAQHLLAGLPSAGNFSFNVPQWGCLLLYTLTRSSHKQT